VGLRDLKKKWTADTEDLHKESLQKKFTQPGVTKLCDVELRRKVKVAGEIKRIRTVPRSGVYRCKYLEIPEDRGNRTWQGLRRKGCTNKERTT